MLMIKKVIQENKNKVHITQFRGILLFSSIKQMLLFKATLSEILQIPITNNQVVAGHLAWVNWLDQSKDNML